MKVDTRELRSELPARGDDPLRLRVAEGRKISVGVGKGQNGTAKHTRKSPSFSLIRKDRPGKPLGSATIPRGFEPDTRAYTVPKWVIVM